MSSYINHFKKTAEQNAKDLQDNEHGVVGLGLSDFDWLLFLKVLA